MAIPWLSHEYILDAFSGQKSGKKSGKNSATPVTAGPVTDPAARMLGAHLIK